MKVPPSLFGITAKSAQLLSLQCTSSSKTAIFSDVMFASGFQELKILSVSNLSLRWLAFALVTSNNIAFIQQSLCPPLTPTRVQTNISWPCTCWLCCLSLFPLILFSVPLPLPHLSPCSPQSSLPLKCNHLSFSLSHQPTPDSPCAMERLSLT